MKKKIAPEDRCPTYFERGPKGKRYVTRRWQCPRKKMKGKNYCAYCEPASERYARLYGGGLHEVPTGGGDGQ